MLVSRRPRNPIPHVFRSHVSLISALIAMLAVADDAAAKVQGNVCGFLGSQRLDKYDSRIVAGVDLSGRQERWPVWLAAYAARSYKSDRCETECGQVRETISEFGVGVRRVWTVGKLRPYLGGGPAWATLRGKIEGSESGPISTSYHRRGETGWWAGAGGLVRVGDDSDFGGGVRYNRLDGLLYGSDLRTLTIHGTVGWSWGDVYH